MIKGGYIRHVNPCVNSLRTRCYLNVAVCSTSNATASLKCVILTDISIETRGVSFPFTQVRQQCGIEPGIEAGQQTRLDSRAECAIQEVLVGVEFRHALHARDAVLESQHLAQHARVLRAPRPGANTAPAVVVANLNPPLGVVFTAIQAKLNSWETWKENI